AVGGEVFVFGAGGEDVRVAVVGQDIETAVGQDHRTPRVAAAGPFGDLGVPDFLAALQLVAVRQAGLFENVYVIADDDAGADALVGWLGMQPQPIIGDIAGAAELDGDGRASEA